jgi:hypothetical protein
VGWSCLSRIAVAHGRLVGSAARHSGAGHRPKHDALILICDARCRRAAMPRQALGLRLQERPTTCASGPESRHRSYALGSKCSPRLSNDARRSCLRRRRVCRRCKANRPRCSRAANRASPTPMNTTRSSKRIGPASGQQRPYVP